MESLRRFWLIFEKISFYSIIEGNGAEARDAKVAADKAEHKQIPLSSASPTPASPQPQEHPELDGMRHITLDGTARNHYCQNVVKTSRYTKWSFWLLNPWEQFQLKANRYFLFIGILQSVPAISTTNGVPTIFTPLALILFISGLRAAIEDYRRHVNDREENNRLYCVYDPTRKSSSKFIKKPAGELGVGDIVKIRSNQSLPSDVLILSSEHSRGHCFVETASLDGETTLKVKSAVIPCHDILYDEKQSDDPEQHFCEQLSNISEFDVYFEPPNPEFEQFKGRIFVEDHTAKLEAANLLLKGTVLKNTEYIYAIVVYTGSDTKIRKSVEGQDCLRVKQSTIEKAVNSYLIRLFAFQAFLCVIGGIWAGLIVSTGGVDHYYLALDNIAAAEEGVLRFFTWYIILAQLVPISFQVSSEVVKTLQAYFISQDVRLYDEDSDRRTSVQTSALNEDLGQIQYIFSDKTGTLTQNRMEFRVALVDSELYGSMETEISRRVAEKRNGAITRRMLGWRALVADIKRRREIERKAQHATFTDRDDMLDAAWCPEQIGVTDEHSQRIRTFLLHMAISNTINPVLDEETHELELQSSSPDELALCQWAGSMGYEFVQRNPSVVKVQKFGRGSDELLKFRLVASLDFNSKRKRVTMLYEVVDDGEEKDVGQLMIMCKGADSTIWPLVKSTPELEAITDDRLIEMSANGLRTLLTAHSIKPMSWWTEKWEEEYETVSALPERDHESNHAKGGCTNSCRICAMMKAIEEDADLQLLGATAIEDRLQELVPECIEDFLEAGIKVWMLTGDKRETAKNIGLACNLIDPDMDGNFEQRSESELDDIIPVAVDFDDLMDGECRLIEITGQAFNVVQNRDAFQGLFDLYDFHRSGRISSDDAIYLQKTLHLSSVAYISERLSASETFNFPELWNIFVGAQVDFKDAVRLELEDGIGLMNSLDLKKKPISMVVEGSALGVLYPRDVGPNAQTKQSVYNIRSYLSSTLSFKELTGPHRKIGNHRHSENMMSVASDPKSERVMQNMFFDLAMKCKSVIACRLTPHQKATLVREVQQRQTIVALAIGDGANDEQMIREANVGVGIAGLEGTAASRSADYVLSKFRYLHTLLFVHGVWSYNRMSTLTNYIFYKTSLTSLSMYMFGVVSQFSGQQYFQDTLFQLYNILFTAAPIIVIAVIDRKLSYKVLEDNPRTYKDSLGGRLFNLRRFGAWLAAAWIHSLSIFIICNYGLAVENVHDETGRTNGIWFVSTAVYSAVVVNATLQILLESYSLTAIHHFFIWISLIGYFVVLQIMGLFIVENEELMQSLVSMGRRLEHIDTSKYGGLKEMVLDFLSEFLRNDVDPEHRWDRLSDRTMKISFNIEEFERLQEAGYNLDLWENNVALDCAVPSVAKETEGYKRQLVELFTEYVDILREFGVSAVDVKGRSVPCSALFDETTTVEELRGRRMLAVKLTEALSERANRQDLIERIRESLLKSEAQLDLEYEKNSEIISMEHFKIIGRYWDFFKIVDAFESITGCYQTNGNHCEKPFEIALRANAMVWSLMDEKCQTELENIEILLTDQGALVYKIYTNGHGFDTSIAWCQFFCHLLDMEIIPGLVCRGNLPNIKTFSILRKYVDFDVVSTLLSYREDWLDEGGTYYDSRPEKAIAGQDLILTKENIQRLRWFITGSDSNADYRSDEAKSRKKKRKQRRRDLSGEMVKSVFDSMKDNSGIVSKLMFMGNEIGQYTRLLVDNGISDRAVLSVGFDWERWKKKVHDYDKSPEQLMETLEIFILNQINEYIMSIEISALLREKPHLFEELQNFIEKSLQKDESNWFMISDRNALLKEMRAIRHGCLASVMISNLDMSVQEALIRWIFKNEDKVWRYRGGRPGFETMSDFLKFIHRSPDGVPCLAGIVFVPSFPEIPADSDELVVRALQTNSIVSYLLGEYDFSESEEEKEQIGDSSVYEMVAAWVRPSYKGMRLAARMYGAVAHRLEVRGCARLRFDVLEDSYDRITDRIAAAALLVKLCKRIGLHRSLILTQEPSYAIYNSHTGRMEQFERFELDLPRVVKILQWLLFAFETYQTPCSILQRICCRRKPQHDKDKDV